MPRAYPLPPFDLLRGHKRFYFTRALLPTNYRAALNGPECVRFEAESVSRVLAEQPQQRKAFAINADMQP